MKKKIIAIIIILLLLGIYTYIQSRVPKKGEFYIRNTTDNKFSSEEQKEIYNILNLNNIDIDIYKTACQVEVNNEGSYYIFFYSSKQLKVSDIDSSCELYCLGYKNGIYEYIISKLSKATNEDPEYGKISKICKANYNLCKNNEKNIDINQLQNFKFIELTPVYDKNGNIIN